MHMPRLIETIEQDEAYLWTTAEGDVQERLMFLREELSKQKAAQFITERKANRNIFCGLERNWANPLFTIRRLGSGNNLI